MLFPGHRYLDVDQLLLELPGAEGADVLSLFQHLFGLSLIPRVVYCEPLHLLFFIHYSPWVQK